MRVKSEGWTMGMAWPSLGACVYVCVSNWHMAYWTGRNLIKALNNPVANRQKP